MKISAIYQIQSKIKPERYYIGSTNNIIWRWKLHLSLLQRGKHHWYKLQNHFNKYSKDDLVLVIIEPCLPEFLIIREQYYIDTLKPYFNECTIAGSVLGIKRSKEFCKKLGERKLGNKNCLGHKCSEETKYKISESNKGNKHWHGKKHSEETKKKMSQLAMGNKRNLGNHLSEDTKKKISEAHKGKKKGAHSDIHKKRQSEGLKKYWTKKKLIV